MSLRREAFLGLRLAWVCEAVCCSGAVVALFERIAIWPPLAATAFGDFSHADHEGRADLALRSGLLIAF